MPQIDHSAETTKRLGVVIALLLRTLPKSGDSLSLRDQVQLLSDLGMRPKDIAEIVGRTSTYVSKELVGIRRNKKGKK
jgi:hypothetical protein